MRKEKWSETHNEVGWFDKILKHKHYSPNDDYYSEEVIEEGRYEYRSEFWNYLEENGYWD